MASCSVRSPPSASSAGSPTGTAPSSPALVTTAEADAKAIAAVAIADAKKAEAALAHVVSGGAWASAESDVKSALVKAYCGIKGIAVSAEHGVEAVLHLSKPTPANTIPTVAPPAAPPKA